MAPYLITLTRLRVHARTTLHLNTLPNRLGFHPTEKLSVVNQNEARKTLKFVTQSESSITAPKKRLKALA